MQQTKSFWKSRTVQSLAALFVAALYFLVQTFNVATPEQLSAAGAVPAEIANAIALVKQGQWFAGISLIITVVAGYFRVKATKLIG